MEDIKLNTEFWDEIKTKYVGEYEDFINWFEKYKIRIGWESYFNPNFTMYGMEWRGVWFSELPDAFQVGIFIQYVSESGSRYGIELPTIESKSDFDKIKGVIVDFFFHEYDNTRQEHLEGKYGSGIV